MARRVGRRRKKSYGIGGRIRRAFHGFVKLGIGGIVTALGTYVTDVLTGHLTFSLGNSTVDLGFLPGIVIVAAGLFVMITGLSEALGTKI